MTIFSRARRQSMERPGALLLAACLTLNAAVPAWASESVPTVSLTGLLEETLRVNPELRSAKTRWEAAQARVAKATGLPAPRIGIELEEIPRGSLKVNQATVMYQLIQAIPFPGKLSLRKQVAVKDAQVAAMAFKQAEWEVLGQLKDAYYELFLIDRNLEIKQQQLAWLKQTAAVAQSRYATGTTSQAEVLQAQSELIETPAQIAVLEQRRQAMVAHVNHLLNRHAHAPLGAPEPLTLQPIALSPGELWLMAQEHQPELLAFRYVAERAEAEWKLARRELWPDLGTMIELRDPAMGPIGPWDLTLALVLPFWFWTKQRYGVKAALYDKDSANEAYQAMANEVTKRIHEHWHEAWGAYQMAKLSSEGLIPLGRQAVTSALAAYQGGRGSFMELLETLRGLAEREQAYYQALVELEQHVAMLEQASGTPLRRTHETSRTASNPR